MGTADAVPHCHQVSSLRPLHHGVFTHYTLSSLQYRLNIFGFPNADGLESNNLAYEDQRAGIEWVRDNVANFGGDPESMVLWGQSAGGQALYFYSAAYPQDPIVKGFFADSAGPPMTSPPSHRCARLIAFPNTWWNTDSIPVQF